MGSNDTAVSICVPQRLSVIEASRKTMSGGGLYETFIRGYSNSGSLRKGILPTLIFLFTLAISWQYFSHPVNPINFPDSVGYNLMAKNILLGRLGDTTMRGPVYSSYLALFYALGHTYGAIYGQLIIFCLTVSLVYCITSKLTRSMTLGIIPVALLLIDFQALSFVPDILTETLTAFLVVLLIYLHLCALKATTSWSTVLPMVIVDLLLIFTKPTFLILPILLYVFHFIAKILLGTDRAKLKRLAGVLLAAISINGLFIVSWSFYNLSFWNDFKFSNASDYTLLDKSIEYGYLGREYENPPKEVKDVIDAYQKAGNPGGPNPVFDRLGDFGYATHAIRLADSYFIRKNAGDYLWRNWSLLPTAMQERTHATAGDPPQSFSRSGTWLRDFDGNFHNWFSEFNIVSVVLSFALSVCLWRRKDRIGSLRQAVILISILYTYGVVVSVTASDYARLAYPVSSLFYVLIATSPYLLIKIASTNRLRVFPQREMRQ